ncbi:helix-turn-helix domain-containing protein [Streptomyces sp. NPDC046832]|uniref:helix-turn-helix domain-containing protein n=1 Tax=Streptomyces sp. NPDC046832 TaxID=3155020 RepID=UPI0033FFAD69
MSTLPEVAALATELTVIFNNLGVTQQQYAVRTNYDKSYVSRFLNGRRVATQEFIDRLLFEVEKQRQSPVTSETRERLKQLRANALRVYDPETYKLEILRHEVDKSQREVKRLLLHQEALEGLLERRQAEADGLRMELLQLQSDWIADRVQSEAKVLSLQGESNKFTDERNALLQQIERLQRELRITIEQRDNAERQCAVLEERILSTEIAIAQRREGEGIDDVSGPIEDVQVRLMEADESEVYRELSEVALTRSHEEVANLCVWLRNNLLSEYATQLASDYCRQRSVDLIARLVLDVEQLPDSKHEDQSLSTAIMRVLARRSLDDLFAVFEVLVEVRRSRSSGRRLIRMNTLAYTWLTHGTSRMRRYRHLLEIIDYLNGLGEQGASEALVRRLAMTVNKKDHYAEVISQSERHHEAYMYASSWLHRMKDQANPHQFVKRMTEMCDESPLVAEAVLTRLPSMYDVKQISYILMGLLDAEQGLEGRFASRLREVLEENNSIEHVCGYVRSLYADQGVYLPVPPAVAELLDFLHAGEGVTPQVTADIEGPRRIVDE